MKIYIFLLLTKLFKSFLDFAELNFAVHPLSRTGKPNPFISVVDVQPNVSLFSVILYPRIYLLFAISIIFTENHRILDILGQLLPYKKANPLFVTQSDTIFLGNVKRIH